jgi:adenosylhomocysteinase
MRKPSIIRTILSRTSLALPLSINRTLLAEGMSRFSFRPFHSRPLHQPLWDAYERSIPLKDRYGLHQLEADWAQRQPLKGKIVLVNVHLTRITLALIAALLKSGAQVEVTVSPELVIHQNALQPLLAAGIPFLPIIPDEKKKYYYDVIYDCGAGMRDLIPNHGMVELTQTHSVLYRYMTFPVMTVDSSQTKVIETGLGTGDSFVRVIHHLARQSITALVLSWKNRFLQNIPHQALYLTTLLSLVNVGQLFSQNKFMIFGFGKVGKGIASALESAGAPKKHIVIVDISPEAYLEARKQSYSGFLLDDCIPESIQKIKAILPDMWAVVTATGVEGAISQHFSASDFDRVAVLANMSTKDDFGSRFAGDRVLNGKKPANFMLDTPTEVLYLDAIFTLFLKAGEELIKNKALKNGLNPIDSAIDQAVLADWIAYHGDGIWRHRLGQLQTEQLIQHLRQQPTPCPQDLVRWMESQGIFHPKLPPKTSGDLQSTSSLHV